MVKRICPQCGEASFSEDESRPWCCNACGAYVGVDLNENAEKEGKKDMKEIKMAIQTREKTTNIEADAVVVFALTDKGKATGVRVFIQGNFSGKTQGALVEAMHKKLENEFRMAYVVYTLKSMPEQEKVACQSD